MTSRRSVILGAVFGTVSTQIVRAESMLDIPGDPLTKRGLFAARKWASDEYVEWPASRIVFSDGATTRWNRFHCMSRPTEIPDMRKYAVAIDTVVTDNSGKRFITSIPLDGAYIERAVLGKVRRTPTLSI